METLPVDPPGHGNGDAFAAFLAAAVNALGQRQVIDYYREALPSATDEQLALLADRFAASSAAQRVRFQQALAPSQRALFGIFGHRAATLAVRQESLSWLRRGLVGVAVANYEIPGRRNVDVGLAVYHHAARRLGADPAALFDAAADLAADPMAAHLRAFGRRTDVQLRSYGWRELRTPDGILFRFQW